MNALRSLVLALVLVAAAGLIRSVNNLADEVRAARVSIDAAAESGARMYRQLQSAGCN